MRTCDYSDVLRGSAALAGLPFESLSTEDFALFRTFHDTRLQMAWEMEKWPDLCPVEQRTFRAPWSATATYGAPSVGTAYEVYDPPSNAYYQSLVAGNLNYPPTTDGVVDNAHWYLSDQQYSGDVFATGGYYAVGNVVLNPVDENYYACTVAGLGGTTLSNGSAQFALLTPFNRYIAYVQTWPPLNSGLPVTTAANPIAEFLQSTHADPRDTTKLVYFHPWLSQDGAQYSEMRREFMYVWLKYRLQRPLLTGCAFNAAAVYASGQQVYYTSTATGKGNFYNCLATTTAGQTPDTTPASWSLVQLPYIFRQYLIRAGLADWLVSDGQEDKFATAEAVALNVLEMEADKLFRQQQQTQRLQMNAA